MTLQDEATATATGDTTTWHDFLPLFPSASYGNGVNDEGEGAMDDDGDNGDGATDDGIDEDGDSNGATDNNDNDDVDGDDSNGAEADDNNVDDDEQRR